MNSTITIGKQDWFLFYTPVSTFKYLAIKYSVVNFLKTNNNSIQTSEVQTETLHIRIKCKQYIRECIFLALDCWTSSLIIASKKAPKLQKNRKCMNAQEDIVYFLSHRTYKVYTWHRCTGWKSSSLNPSCHTWKHAVAAAGIITPTHINE